MMWIPRYLGKPLFRLLAGWLGSILILFLAGGCWAEDNDVSGLRAVPEALVYADSDINNRDDIAFAVIVDKSRQMIYLYRQDVYWRMVFEYPCSTGKLTGPKATEGDKRTPEGVYFAVRDVDASYLTDTYGSRALPLDYPNWLDKRNARTGSAIWMHGTNKELQARESNGCIVLDNETIERVAPFIGLQRTPVIIVDRLRLWALRDAQKSADAILTALEQWHKALMHGSYDDFQQYYAREVAPSMQWWHKWCRLRSNKALQSELEDAMMRRAIYRWKDDYVLLFDHILNSEGRCILVGRRKLYLRLNGDAVQIFGDTYQTVHRRRHEPLIQAWRQLTADTGGDSRMAANVKKGPENYSLE